MGGVGDKGYQNKLIILFFFTWGFLFLDRLSISFILPVIVPELSLTNGQVGIVNMAFTIAWGASAIVFGAIADKSGNLKRWLMITGFLTAVFGCLCALSSSFGTLVIFRALVGVAEGPFISLLMAILSKSVSKDKTGIAVGVVNAGVYVIAMLLGPILLTRVIQYTGWNLTFLVAALPGLVFMFAVWRFLKPVPVEEKEATAAAETAGVAEATGGASSANENNPKKGSMFVQLWSYRNFRLCCILAAVHMAGYYVMQIFASLYWTEVAGMDLQTVGNVIAAAGFVGLLLAIVTTKLSDIYGRKIILILCYITCILPSLFMFLFPGSTVSIVFYIAFSGMPGALGVFWMNIIPFETLPSHLTATGMAIPMSIGEFIGGALITTIAGFVADAFGLPSMMIIASIGYVVSFVIALLFIETAPRVLEKRSQKLQQQP